MFVIWYAVILFQYRCYLRRREKDYSNNITFSEWTCYLCQPLRNILKIDLTEMMACPKKVVKLIQFSLQLLLLLLLAGIYRTIIVWRSTLEFNFFLNEFYTVVIYVMQHNDEYDRIEIVERKWKSWNHNFDNLISTPKQKLSIINLVFFYIVIVAMHFYYRICILMLLAKTK